MAHQIKLNTNLYFICFDTMSVDWLSHSFWTFNSMEQKVQCNLGKKNNCVLLICSFCKQKQFVGVIVNSTTGFVYLEEKKILVS